MNKKVTDSTESKGIFKRFGKLNGKIKDIILLAILALALIFAAWKIFHKDDSDSDSVSAQTGLSEIELKVARLLEEIEGVGEASVMVSESEDGVEGVVVVCEGAENFSVIMDVREAVAAALGTEQSAVKIYLKKD